MTTKTKEQILRSEEQIYELRNTIRYDIRELEIKDLVSKYDKGLGYIEEDEDGDSKFYHALFTPEYQRGFTWDKIRQSQFIESVILGIPVPLMFMAESKASTWEIVDGSQRIRTLHSFVGNTLCLTGLERNNRLNDFYFKDMDPYRQDKILKTSVRMILFSKDTDEETKRDLFERLNWGSDLLKPMEKRRAAKPGIFTQFICERCAEIPLLDKLAPIDKWLQKWQEKEELILRYFALTEEDNYLKLPEDMDMVKYLDYYLESKNKELSGLSESEKNKVLDDRYRDFAEMLNFVDKYSICGFRKSHNSRTKRVLFEAISVGVHLALKQKPDLIFSKDSWDKMMNSDSLRRSCAGSMELSNAKREYRIADISSFLVKEECYR